MSRSLALCSKAIHQTLTTPTSRRASKFTTMHSSKRHRLEECMVVNFDAWPDSRISLSGLFPSMHPWRSPADRHESPSATPIAFQSHWSSPPSPLSGVARAALAASSAVMALRNPQRADLVGVVSEATAGRALRALTARVAESPGAGPLLRARSPARFPAPEVDADVLRAMPDGSLGREYGRFMERRGFEIGGRGRTEVRRMLVVREDEAWVLQRYRDVHDLWHVLCDVPTSLLGEVALKWFEAVQTGGLPGVAMGALAGPVRLEAEERALVARELVPWALKAGNRAVDLISVPYEDFLETDLTELRSMWRILTPREFMTDPSLLYRKKAKKNT